MQPTPTKGRYSPSLLTSCMLKKLQCRFLLGSQFCINSACLRTGIKAWVPVGHSKSTEPPVLTKQSSNSCSLFIISPRSEGLVATPYQTPPGNSGAIPYFQQNSPLFCLWFVTSLLGICQTTNLVHTVSSLYTRRTAHLPKKLRCC